MSNAYKKKILLNFNPDLSFNPKGRHVRDGLSATLRTGNNLWIACDERSTIERLTLNEDGAFGHHVSYNLNEYLTLPANADCEIDIEGFASDGKYLWLVGSHSLMRKKPKKDESPEKQIKRLAKVKEDPNRYLLARIPLSLNESSGDYELCKICPDKLDYSETASAAQLAGDGVRNQLMEALENDVHFKHFLKIPGKDNGFDIEGIAVRKDKVFLGIRGPVLRGWAVILELRVEELTDNYFRLKPDKKHRLYKKHFLHLEGMGIRDLQVLNDDLLVLAGPSMDLDGTIAVYRWKNGLKQEDESITHRKELDRLFDIPHGHGETSGKDKAEGITLFDPRHLLVVFDSPTSERKNGDAGVEADLYEIPF
ncbi:DUF3616 domain-containing protein [Pedobacter sp. SYSU D00535]|uniref:DUF3616 domain-containing protein n=1 Tax=Pedobacter sp. SYSU D00535 TaxID=2810308 RepID=UPI001A970763|nr:DUF3616 domain-containing protein [Pedobacter sp. SYSU D00535]